MRAADRATSVWKSGVKRGSWGLLTAWLPLVPGLLVLGLLARRSVL
ncbi:hypothetical protein OHA74_13195 [Streptomyces phaeochromogenes]|nr:hypothetical protein [Streptomyces phaeochromogenes]